MQKCKDRCNRRDNRQWGQGAACSGQWQREGEREGAAAARVRKGYKLYGSKGKHTSDQRPAEPTLENIFKQLNGSGNHNNSGHIATKFSGG